MKHEFLKGTELYEKEKLLSEYAAADKVIAAEDLKKILAETESSVFTTPTGVESLDRILENVEAGELVIVTGPTGEGKTTLLMSITRNMALAGHNTVWFTLEVTPRQFIKKLDMSDGALPLFYIPQAGFDDTDIAYVKAWETRYRRKYTLLDWIEDRIIEAKVKYDTKESVLKAVFIDHLQMIYSTETFKQNVSLEIGDLAGQIKSLALHYNLTVFLIAHCKDPQEGSPREPRKQDIRDSGLISRAADIILGVWRIPNSSDGHETVLKQIAEEDNKAKVKIMKNRRTGKLGYFTAYVKDHYLSEDFDFGGL